MGRRILALIVKEFLALLKDPRSRTILIVPPLVQLIVFGYAATYDLNDVPYAVYDRDDSAASRRLLAGFAGSRSFRGVGRIEREGRIAEMIDRREALLVIRFDPQFSRDLQAGRPASVQVIVDGRNSNTALIALGYVNEIVERFNAEWSAEHGGQPPPLTLQTRAWFNPNLSSQWFMIPGIVGLLTLVVTILVTALSVARERERGTFDQLLVTPLRPFEILVGKAAPGLLIGIAEASLIVLVAVTWFHIPLRGNLLTLYVGLALFLASAIGVGLMISSMSVTMQQGLLGAFLFLVPSVILSGLTTPIENMPPVVQAVTVVNPMRYFLVILRGVFLEGTPLPLLADQLWPLAVIAAVTLSAAAWLFRHRMS